MRPALARHDAIVRAAIESHDGTVVKMTGDGVCAAFSDPLDAVSAVLELQQKLVDPAATNAIRLRVRSGLHLGVVEHRDGDYFGNPINRAARIMNAAHGGQVLVSQAVVDLVHDRLPGEVTLRDLGSIRLRDLDEPRAHLPVAASGTAAGLPGAAIACRNAEQPPASGHFVRRAATRSCGDHETARGLAAADAVRDRWNRQDAAVAQARGQCARRLSGRRLARRSWRR